MDLPNQGLIAQAANALEYSMVSKGFTALGVLMVLIGHLFRVWSMFHAGKSFNHLVQTRKAQDHELVTSGPYSWSRHPSYFGWTTWAVGT
jgi:protein-S-isoprenylcysteine O-methyltransferase